jgi:hypothetical protein
MHVRIVAAPQQAELSHAVRGRIFKVCLSPHQKFTKRCRVRFSSHMRFAFATLVALLAVEAAHATDLVIVELGSSNELKWADVKTLDVAVPLTVENRGEKALKNIVLDVTPFAGSGRAAIASPASSPIGTLKPWERKTVTITAKLSAAVTYRATVRLRQGTTVPVTGTIEIARTRGTAPIDVVEAPAQPVDLDLSLHPESVTFTTYIARTDEKVTLPAPALRSVTYKTTADAQSGIAAPEVGIQSTPSAEYTIDGDPQKVDITLTGIRNPGRYDAAIALGGSLYAPTTTTLTVYARQSGWVAAAAIFVGVLVSLFLRVFGVVGRPSLLNKERANTLFQELDECARLASNDAPALATVQDVRRKLTDYWNGLSSAGQLTNSGVLDVYAAKIAALLTWVQLRKHVRQLDPPWLAAPFVTQLQAAELVLRDRTANSAAVVAQASILDKMPTTIDNAVKEELGKRLTNFIAELKPDQRPQVKALLPLAEALQIALGQAALDDTRAELDRLQRRHIRILADELATHLTPAAPVGLEKEWTMVSAAVTANLNVARTAPTAAAASEAFQAALTTFLRSVISGLTTALDGTADAANEAEYDQARAPLAEAAVLLDKGQLLDSWRKLDAAQKLYNTAALNEKTNLGPGDIALAAATAAPPSSAGFDLITIFTGGASAEAIARPEAMRSLKSLRRTGEVVASFLILAAAVLTGLQTLWIGKLTWGGWPAILAAFLWGVAFDQFTHAGLVTLLRRT